MDPAVNAGPREEEGGDRPSPGRGIELAGVVVEASTSFPLVAAHVRIYGFQNADAAHYAVLEASTDERGEFTVQAPDRSVLGSLGTAEVRQPPGDRVFLGPVTLQKNMWILVEPELSLRGRLVVQGGTEIPTGSEVQVFAGTRPEQFHVGRAPLGEEGSFTVTCRSRSLPQTCSLTFLLEGRARFTREVSTGDLRSPHGATIPVELLGLTILAEERDGDPIPGCEIRLGSDRGGARSLVVAETDARGEAAVILDAPVADYCIAKEGYRTETGTVDVSSTRRLAIPLDVLRPSQRIEGRVVGPNGRGIGEAFVSATPATPRGFAPDVEAAGMFSAVSDPDGVFAFLAEADVPLEVRAYKRGFGLSALVLAEPPLHDVVLVLTRRGDVVVRPQGCPSIEHARPGRIEYVLASQATPFAFSRAVPNMPISEIEVPEGPYNVLVYAAHLGVFARGAVEIIAGKDSVFVLPCARPRFIEGTVRDAAGMPLEGMEVRALPRGWPLEAIDRWALDSTDRSGRFRVLVGTDRQALVRIGGEEGTMELVLSSDSPRDVVFRPDRSRQ